MNTLPILGVIWALVVLCGTMFFWQDRLLKFFHLTDSRALLSESSWQKLSALWQAGEADVYTFKFMGEMKFTVNLTYKEGEERLSMRFQDADINKAVTDAYDWSVARGYIKHDTSN